MSTALFNEFFRLKQMTDEQLLDLHDTHDCHLSPMDSCRVCEEVYERGMVKEKVVLAK